VQSERLLAAGEQGRYTEAIRQLKLSVSSRIVQLKMVCFIVEFRQVIGDRFQDASRRRENHLFSDRLKITTHSNSDRLEITMHSAIL
jgi:hypothetical protein